MPKLSIWPIKWEGGAGQYLVWIQILRGRYCWRVLINQFTTVKQGNADTFDKAVDAAQAVIDSEEANNA